MEGIEIFYISQNSFSYCGRIHVAAVSPDVVRKSRARAGPVLRIVNRDGSQDSHLCPCFIVFLLVQGVETDMTRRSPLWRKFLARALAKTSSTAKICCVLKAPGGMRVQA
jgi:hypothetical protein